MPANSVASKIVAAVFYYTMFPGVDTFDNAFTQLIVLLCMLCQLSDDECLALLKTMRCLDPTSAPAVADVLTPPSKNGTWATDACKGKTCDDKPCAPANLADTPLSVIIAASVAPSTALFDDRPIYDRCYLCTSRYGRFAALLANAFEDKTDMLPDGVVAPPPASTVDKVRVADNFCALADALKDARVPGPTRALRDCAEFVMANMTAHSSSVVTN